jgi:hypothetical protein
LPNEVSIAVIHYLPKFSLYHGQGVSKLWKESVETDVVTSKAKFRLPHATRTSPDPAVKRAFVGQLWEVLYARKNEGECIWNFVSLNPLLQSTEGEEASHCVDEVSSVTAWDESCPLVYLSRTAAYMRLAG